MNLSSWRQPPGNTVGIDVALGRIALGPALASAKTVAVNAFSGFPAALAGGGKIDVAVEAIGFSATLSLRTTGNKQTVQISSKGDIRGVSITMVKS